jgi:hypothetical protein
MKFRMDLEYLGMTRVLCLLFLLWSVSEAGAQAQSKTPMFDTKTAERFANLALACVHKEYPNHISHTLSSDADVAPPRKLTPAFYGCYDWHSSVHGHWLLVRLVRTFPDAPFVEAARDALRQSLTAENLTPEAAYLRGAGRASFERPYGLAWLLQLTTELREWDDPQAREMAANLRPLEQVALERLSGWLPKLSNPVRIGEHDQTAFALGLMLDYAQGGGDQKFAELVATKSKQFYLRDKNCPLEYEPSGEDFLSPCLGEADVMRRVLPSREFAAWLQTFMPQMSTSGSAAWLQPVVSPDPSDPKLAHLDGLNLSRCHQSGRLPRRTSERDWLRSLESTTKVAIGWVALPCTLSRVEVFQPPSPDEIEVPLRQKPYLSYFARTWVFFPSTASGRCFRSTEAANKPSSENRART